MQQQQQKIPNRFDTDRPKHLQNTAMIEKTKTLI